MTPIVAVILKIIFNDLLKLREKKNVAEESSIKSTKYVFNTFSAKIIFFQQRKK